MKYLKQDQSGAASLLFTLIMIIIISLLAIGFSVITTNDQKETLNKNLSSNTEYAAQSAINSVVEAITAKNPLVASTMSTCQKNSNNAIIPTFPGTNNSISCVKWTYNPVSLTYNATNAANTVINPQTTGVTPTPTKLTELDITWSSTSTSFYPNPSTLNLNAAASSKFPILRIVTANKDMSQYKTTYVYPTSGGGATPIDISSTSSDGIYINQTKNCTSASGTGTCTVGITGFNGLPGGWDGDSSSCTSANVCGLVSVTTLDGSAVTISISGKSSSGGSVTLADSQIQIDATAVNGDSVKRLVAGYAINQSSGWSPSFAAASSTNPLAKNYQYDFPNGNAASNAGPASGTTSF